MEINYLTLEVELDSISNLEERVIGSIPTVHLKQPTKALTNEQLQTLQYSILNAVNKILDSGPHVGGKVVIHEGFTPSKILHLRLAHTR